MDPPEIEHFEDTNLFPKCKKKLLKEKMYDIVERYLEKCISLEDKSDNPNIICDNISLVVILFMFIMSGVTIYEKLPLNQFDFALFFGKLACIFISSLEPFLSRSYSYKYKRHFTDIDPVIVTHLRNCILCLFFYAVFAILLGLTVWDILAIFGLLIVGINVLFPAIMDAQKKTKLRHDPLDGNHMYKLAHIENKDKGLVRILESSVFKVTLKNIGSEIWDSSNCALFRYTFNEDDADGPYGPYFSTSLPVFSLLPEEQIDLIPESRQYEGGKCIRVPHLHAFGVWDRMEQVETVISNIKDKYKSNSEKIDFSEPCYGKKIAEHVASYDYNLQSEWTNVENWDAEEENEASDKKTD